MGWLQISIIFAAFFNTGTDSLTIFTPYEAFIGPKSYDDAKASCEARGMTLAKDTTESSHSALLAVVRARGIGKGDVWINGILDSDDRWITDDGTALSSDGLWATGKPDGSGRCLQLRASMEHQWDDDLCEVTKAYVCEPAAYGDSSYVVFSEPKGQREAQASCEALGMTLARDTSVGSHYSIVTTLKVYGLEGTDVWIDGLRDSDGAWITNDDAELPSYHSWADGEPNGSGRCLQLWSAKGHQWDDTSCYFSKAYICEPAAPFMAFRELKTYSDAEASCDSNGMTLARDTSESIHSAILAVIRNNGLDITDVWVNGQQDSNNRWITSDGVELTSYHPWATGEPNESGRCIQLWANKGHLWDDTPCSAKQPYICEIEGVKSPTKTYSPSPQRTDAPSLPPSHRVPTLPRTDAPEPSLPPQPSPTARVTTPLGTNSGCELPLGLHNVAEGKPTAQSSDKPKKDSGSDNAVDGNFNTDASKRSCSWTNKEFQPWWRVDLGSTYNIYEVVITNRADCCQFRIKEAEIRVGNSENFEDNPTCGQRISNIQARENPIHVRCGCETPMSGQFVSVQLINVKQMLTMCEVEVMAL
ncbi:macrophage mannose receptor 1-like [Ptychodera flava]|uniref:macrophage mannose receptor 1-like n=1 Tax=Ptychodera flava TaxID=63121 RepID=UPI003969BE20